jgi:hypothetical protein
MKQNQTKQTDRVLAHTIVFAATSLISALINLVLFWAIRYIDPAFLKSLPPIQALIAISAATFSSLIIVKMLLFRIAIQYGVIGTVALHIKATREQKIARLQKEQQERAIKIAEQKKYLREAYEILQVRNGGTPLTFIIELSDDVFPEYQPTVFVNGVPIGTTNSGPRSLTCYTKKALSAENETITFNIGTNTFETKNPYYFARAIENTPIRWQCEGHVGERKILIPTDYFPYVNNDTLYEFNLKINHKSFGTFIGKIDSSIGTLVIPLGKYISKNMCLNKEVVLSLTFGTCPKLTLPKPIVMFKNGSPIS